VETQVAGPADEAIAEAMHRLAAAWAADDVQLAKQLRVTPGDFLALKHVAVSAGIGPAQLAGRLGMSTGSVNALVNRLAAAGHLERQRHQCDGRRLILLLSDGTRAAIVGYYHARTRLVADAVGPLTAEQRRAILHFLDSPAWTAPVIVAASRPRPKGLDEGDRQDGFVSHPAPESVIRG
jgi:DNA-binding MarR family transcriptional regulator